MRGRNEQRTNKAKDNNYIFVINPITTIATLNVNGLNRWIKDRDCLNGLKRGF